MGAEFQTRWRGMSKHERGDGLQLAAERPGRAGRLEAQGPPGLALHADLGEFHSAARSLVQPWRARPP